MTPRILTATREVANARSAPNVPRRAYLPPPDATLSGSRSGEHRTIYARAATRHRRELNLWARVPDRLMYLLAGGFVGATVVMHFLGK